jgi:hypothetical protein
MKKKTFMVYANGMDFYCEMMGQGPSMVLVPPGSNDCGTYENLMECLADEFTVLTFDPRGGSRSPDPHPRPVTPELFSDDREFCDSLLLTACSQSNSLQSNQAAINDTKITSCNDRIYKHEQFSRNRGKA